MLSNVLGVCQKTNKKASKAMLVDQTLQYCILLCLYIVHVLSYFFFLNILNTGTSIDFFIWIMNSNLNSYFYCQSFSIWHCNYWSFVWLNQVYILIFITWMYAFPWKLEKLSITKKSLWNPDKTFFWVNHIECTIFN